MAALRRKLQMRWGFQLKGRGSASMSIGSTLGLTSVSDIWYISYVERASGNAPQDAATSSPAPQAGHGGELSARVTSQEDAIAKSLEACLSIFRSGLLQDICIEDLVFCKLSIKDQLLDDLRNEWVRLDDLKLCAWQMALCNDGTTASLSNPGPTTSDLDSTQVIDTSLHFEMPLLSSDIQPVVIVVYILVAVMHIVSGLSLRDCGQLLFTLKLLINLMVEDFHTADGQGKFLALLATLF
ncbi:hypothetical protein V8E53_014377 [Lactarius tabidus]